MSDPGSAIREDVTVALAGRTGPPRQSASAIRSLWLGDAASIWCSPLIRGESRLAPPAISRKDRRFIPRTPQRCPLGSEVEFVLELPAKRFPRRPRAQTE